MKKKKARKPRSYGWQVIVPVYNLEAPTRFDYESAAPTVFLSKERAEASRVRAERAYLADILPYLDEHIENWNHEDEVVETFLTKFPVGKQRAFIRAFLPELWDARGRSWLASSDDVVRNAFRQASFDAPRRAPALAWEAAHTLLDPYLSWPYLRKVRLVP